MHKVSYLLILILTWPIRWMPYRMIHAVGAFLGTAIYHLFPKYRKRALSNLALASSLQLTEEQIRRHAKESLQNLIITCLEYAKFDSEKQIHHVASCINPETADRLMKENKPVIFFCGHQSNWEVLFLEGTSRMPGVAIGRPIKNKLLYNWVTSIRQKFGGKMIAPQNAIREGLRGLKKGAFLGIVGDQGMPNSGFSSPFFGRNAWTSPIAAILSHRTGSPIIVATTHRSEGKYSIHYSEPIWPNTEAPLESETERLMVATLANLEKKIAEAPGQWLWSHNRWKQQTRDRLKLKFRHESILVILPKQKKQLDAILPHLNTFREIYPLEFFTIYSPVEGVTLENAEIIPYQSEKDTLKSDYRFKLIFNLASYPHIERHYKRLAAFEVVSLPELHAMAGCDGPFDKVLKKAILKREEI